jgi:hypothetical protein
MEATFKRGLELNPRDPYLLTYLGQHQLREGAFVRGFRNREARWELTPHNQRMAALPFAWWCGQSLSGRALLLLPESSWGLGDELQYCRFIGEVMSRARGGLVELRAH